MKLRLKSRTTTTASIYLMAGIWTLFASNSLGQIDNKWLSAGSLHNWYSEMGAEREVGFETEMQYGMRWPGIFNKRGSVSLERDMQVSKTLWIGVTNVTDDTGRNWTERVVHVGPRVTGIGAFFPIRFEMVSKFEPPAVFVDGRSSESPAPMANDRVDGTIVPDRMIVNEVNTLLGLTMERKIYQFSQDFHDSYHVLEHTFTNTGNTDGDTEIELPNQTLEDVYFFWQWRWAVAAETRYVIGNATGWGKNTMNDVRGDGVLPDPPGEDMRAQFAWHGHLRDFTFYDNIGGPILVEALPAMRIDPADTLGRLGASAFVGHVVLHADASATDETDDPAQPTTTTWFDSDIPLTSMNSAFDPERMAEEYALMSSGHKTPRHAYAVEPTGEPGWLQPTADPSLGKAGGATQAEGYGPYTIGPGESIKIIFAEAANGLSQEENTRVGRLYQQGLMSDLEKNQVVFQSRDSLFMMFRSAIANYASGWDIPRPPYPPSLFEVEGGSDRILLSWDVFDEGPAVDRFEIYRARGRHDSTYTLLHSAPPDERSFDDTTAVRGFDYYYYLQAVGLPGDNDGVGNTPAEVALRSSRYYTQTYDPVQVRFWLADENLQLPIDAVLHQTYPNPFAEVANIHFELPHPGRVQLAIYDVTGRKVASLVDGMLPAGSHTKQWLATNVASGLYLSTLRFNGRTQTRRILVAR